jgi:hypothetical protein
VAIVAALAINASGLHTLVPQPLGQPVVDAVSLLGGAALPMGLLLVGATLYEQVEGGAWRRGLNPPLMALACLLRLGLIPLLMLGLLWSLPGVGVEPSIELQRVAAVQAAMPAAIFPIVLSKHYGGHPATAVNIVLATSALSLLTIPLWLNFALG